MQQIQLLLLGTFVLLSESFLDLREKSLVQSTYFFVSLRNPYYSFIDIQMVNSIVCYECTGCPKPFTSNYPYVTLTNNTNFLAQCTVSFLL